MYVCSFKEEIALQKKVMSHIFFVKLKKKFKITSRKEYILISYFQTKFVLQNYFNIQELCCLAELERSVRMLVRQKCKQASVHFSIYVYTLWHKTIQQRYNVASEMVIVNKTGFTHFASFSRHFRLSTIPSHQVSRYSGANTCLVSYGHPVHSHR